MEINTIFNIIKQYNNFNIHDIVDQVYCINMPKAGDRRKFMKEQSDLYKLNIKFYNAIDFAQFFNTCRTNYLNFILESFRYDYWELASQQFGCLFSHYSVIKNAYLLGLNKIMVLEDDVCFFKDIAKFYEILYKIPSDADFIKLEAMYDILDKNCDNTIANNFFDLMHTTDFILINQYKDLLNNNNNKNLYSMGFYIMNRKMMEKYIDFVENKISIKPKVSDDFNTFFDYDNFKTYQSSIYLGIQYKLLFQDFDPIIRNDLFCTDNYNIPENKLTQTINY